MGSYGVGIWHFWNCLKACEISSLLVQKKKKFKNVFLLIGCPNTKQVETNNFLSGGILGVNIQFNFLGAFWYK